MSTHYDLGNVMEFIEKIKSGQEQSNPRTFHRDDKLSFGVQLFKSGDHYTNNKGEYPKHEFDEIYFVLEGNGKLEIGDKQLDVVPGHAYLIPKNIPHRFHDNSQDIVFCYIFGGQDEVYYSETKHKMDDKNKANSSTR